MDTKRIAADSEQSYKEALKQAAQLLRAGQLVAFPTETVYGLGANALDAQACARIYEVKGRPSDNPLIIHIANLAMADALIKEWTPSARLCAETFWPGPLTLVLPKSPAVPDLVTGGLETVALRMPSHPVALAMIERAGIPVAAPSANLSGKPSPTSADHVWRDLQGRIPLILDGGACSVGVESTVLDVSGELPVILRPGGITREQLEDVLGPVGVDQPSGEEKPKAPGMKYRHYAPKGEMILFVGNRLAVTDKITGETTQAKLQGKKVGILCTTESLSLLKQTEADLFFDLGSAPEEIAANLYEGLRLCDLKGVDLILAQGVGEEGLGLAIMNRLVKAAGNRLVYV